MDVFKLRKNLVNEFGNYVKSFIQIKDDRIRSKVDSEINEGLLWPAPLIQLNPCFEYGPSIEELVTANILHPECKKIFRSDKKENYEGHTLKLYKHQTEAIHKAHSEENYILSTGTGSGKSLAYIIPCLFLIVHLINIYNGLLFLELLFLHSLLILLFAPWWINILRDTLWIEFHGLPLNI